MAEITLYNDEFITTKYLDDKKIIYLTTHKPSPDQVFKDALIAGSDALRKYGACKWLSDDRKIGPISPELMEYGRTEWHPRAIADGWKYWANVVPEEIAAAGSLVPVIDNLHTLGLRMRVFTTLEKAFEWLDQMEC